MITWQVKELVNKEADPPTYYCQGTCLSTDEKPTRGIANGSNLIEMNTSKIYFYDAASSQWDEWGAST